MPHSACKAGKKKPQGSQSSAITWTLCGFPPQGRRSFIRLQPTIWQRGEREIGEWMNVETITNVVDVYVNHLRRKVDSGYDRPLIRTVRGTGYQIGTNGFTS